MRLVKHRGKWSVAGVIDGKPGKWSTGFDATPENRPAAERKKEDLERQLAKPVGNTFGEIFPAYIKDRQAVRADRQETSWVALAPHFSRLTPDQVTREVCRAYIKARRKAKRGDGTIRKELSDLRAAANWYDKSNAAVWDMPTAPEPRERWLSREEFKRLLKAAEGTHHLTVFLHLAIATAGRKEALLTLTWDQVFFDRGKHGQIWLGTKANGKKRATVPMTKRLREVLLEAKKGAIGETVVEWAGEPIKNVRKAFESARDRAKLGKDVTIHTIRHTSAVWMANDGRELWEISSYLGHSDIRVTQRIYAKHQPDYLQEAASSLEV